MATVGVGGSSLQVDSQSPSQLAWSESWQLLGAEIAFAV